mmetsp:Transcript_14680/g.40581  ORF Transcript_14680/g.40581 Transcript_14680/m.40581 type:complete len:103 (-) Transcript_14680:190-498(-)
MYHDHSLIRSGLTCPGDVWVTLLSEGVLYVMGSVVVKECAMPEWKNATKHIATLYNTSETAATRAFPQATGTTVGMTQVMAGNIILRFRCADDNTQLFSAPL